MVELDRAFLANPARGETMRPDEWKEGMRALISAQDVSIDLFLNINNHFGLQVTREDYVKTRLNLFNEVGTGFFDYDDNEEKRFDRIKGWDRQLVQALGIHKTGTFLQSETLSPKEKAFYQEEPERPHKERK